MYYVLKKSDDPGGLAGGFYEAVMTGDETTKAQYHEQYWPYTKEELRSHVDGLIGDIDGWSKTANLYDLDMHPHDPLILQHNAFVRDTVVQDRLYLGNI